MCDPVTAMAAVTAVLGAYSSYEQGQAQKTIFENNQDIAIRSALDQYEAQGAQANQRREAAGQSATQNALQAAKARSTATAAAADSNISGLSVDSVLNEITGQEGQNYSNIAANEAAAADQQYRQGKGITSEAMSRINSVERGGYNPVLGLLQIGAQVGSVRAAQIKGTNQKFFGGTTDATP